VEEADAGAGLPGDVEGLRLDVAVARLVDARVVRADHHDLVEPLRPAKFEVVVRHALTSFMWKTMSPIIPRWTQGDTLYSVLMQQRMSLLLAILLVEVWSRFATARSPG